jgi:hypothetical protein
MWLLVGFILAILYVLGGGLFGWVNQIIAWIVKGVDRISSTKKG